MFTDSHDGPENHVFRPESRPTRAHQLRSLAAQILLYAEALSSADKALAKALFEDGRSASDVARLAGLTTRSVHRRVRRLLDRVSSPRFVFVLNHRPAFGRTRARVATACVLHGLSMREASRQLSLPIHCVRAHMAAVNGMFDRLSRVI